MAKQPLALQRAQQMRGDPTKAEDVLWWHLREQKPAFGKFRRQEPIDCYIADFVSYEHRLIIEVDGSHHDVEQDRVRDNYLKYYGFRIIRFSNEDILRNMNMALDNIYLAVSDKNFQPTDV